MPKASIWIEDKENGGVDVGVDFGESYEPNSQAHAMIGVLIESVLANAKSYTQVEDNVPELDVEPQKIITN